MTLPKEFTLAIDELKASIQESQERLELLEDRAKKQIEDNDIIEPKEWRDLSGFFVDEELDVLYLDSLSEYQFCSNCEEELNHFIAKPMGLADISLIRKIKQNSPWADYEPDWLRVDQYNYFIEYRNGTYQWNCLTQTQLGLNVYFPSEADTGRILKSFLHAKGIEQ